MNAAALVNAYGPYGLLPQGIVTVGQDFISAINGSIANRPELAGNQIQDIIHSTMWIGGKAVQLTFNNTLGAIFPKTKIKNKSTKKENFKSLLINDISYTYPNMKKSSLNNISLS